MSHSTSRRTGAHPQNGPFPTSDRAGWPPLRRLRAWLGQSPSAAVRGKHPQRFTAIDACAAFRHGDEFLQRCRQERIPVAVLVFELHDLPELECVFGPQAARSAIDHAAVRLQCIAGTAGKVLRTDPTRFIVLLPDVDKVDVMELLHGTLGQSCSLELEVDGEDLVLMPEFAIRIVSAEALALVDVQHELCCEIWEARAREQQRRDYLHRERESHSRSMPLPRPMPPLGRVQPESYPRIPVTVSLPLGRR